MLVLTTPPSRFVTCWQRLQTVRFPLWTYLQKALFEKKQKPIPKHLLIRGIKKGLGRENPGGGFFPSFRQVLSTPATTDVVRISVELQLPEPASCDVYTTEVRRLQEQGQ